MSTTLSLRKTRRYVAGWAHEDEWEDIGSFDIVAKSDPDVDEYDACEGTRVVLFVEVDTDASPEQIRDALHASFSGSSCRHEYDCCGCWSTFATATHINHNLWRVETRSSRNY